MYSGHLRGSQVLGLWLGTLGLSCGGARKPVFAAAAPPPSAHPAAVVASTPLEPAPAVSEPSTAARSDASPASRQDEAPPAEPVEPQPSVPESPCPADSIHVQKQFCPDLRLRCIKSEYERSNHLTICHKFDPSATTCNGDRISLDFCIDRYEYPNQPEGHPPVMVDFHDAARLCGEAGKRLCTEREWTAACEGPEDKPFPYGYSRSSEACNIDNTWIDPSLSKIYSSNPAVRDRELRRLDQSVPSGKKEGCVSDYGVYDLTGNFDEWVQADPVRSHKPSKQSALKGGAWGHVRNACRPVTTSHEPEFRYYFVSFRCCSDPRATGSEVPSTSVSAPRAEDQAGAP